MPSSYLSQTHSNRVLACLPEVVMKQLWPRLVPVDLPEDLPCTNRANRFKQSTFWKQGYVPLWQR